MLNNTQAQSEEHGQGNVAQTTAPSSSGKPSAATTTTVNDPANTPQRQKSYKSSKTDKGIEALDVLLTVKNLNLGLKLGFLIVMLFLVVSVVMNILQAIENSCKNVDKKIDRLAAQNDQLKETKDELLLQQQRLNQTIIDFGQQNDELEKNLANLENVHVSLESTVESLRIEEEALSSLVSEYNTTFADFETQVNELMSDLSDSNQELSSLISTSTTLTANISQVRVALSTEEVKLREVTSAYQIITDVTNRLGPRDEFYSSAVLGELRDLELNYVDWEYRELFENIEEIFFEDNSVLLEQLKSEFPFEEGFSYSEARAILPQIRVLLLG